MNAIFFITQELCDEASLFIAMKHDVNVKITRSKVGVIIEAVNKDTDFPMKLVTDVFLHYLRYHFLEDEELEVLRLASICYLQGKMMHVLGLFSHYKEN